MRFGFVHPVLAGFLSFFGCDTLLGVCPQPETSIHRVTLGKVVDESGAPIPNAEIVCADVQGLGDKEYHESVSRTNEQGDFELEFRQAPGRPRSMRHLWVYKEGYNLACVANLERKLHRIDLRPADTFEFQVVAPDGTPVSAAVISADYFYAPNGVYRAAQSTGLSTYIPRSINAKLSAISDDAGNVTLRGYPEGLLASVKVEASGYGSQSFPANADVLQLAPSASLEIHLEDGSPADLGREIIIRTRTQPNLPKNVLGKVIALPSRAEIRRQFDEQGKCYVDAIMADSPLEVAVAQDESSEFIIAHPDQFTLAAGQHKVITLLRKPPIKISGQVLAGDVGVPLASISIRHGNNSLTTVTDEVGCYSAKVLPGPVRLQVFILPGQVQKEFRYPASKQLQIAAEIEDINFELPKQEFVEGVILDAQEVPIQNGVPAAISQPFGHVILTGACDSEGKFKATVRNGWKRRIEEAQWVLFPNFNSLRTADREQLPQLEVVSLDPLVLKVKPTPP